MILAAVLHLGDVGFTAVSEADPALVSDLQLLEQGQWNSWTIDALTCSSPGWPVDGDTVQKSQGATPTFCQSGNQGGWWGKQIRLLLLSFWSCELVRCTLMSPRCPPE